MTLTVGQKTAIREIESLGGSVFLKGDGDDRVVEQILVAKTDRFTDSHLHLLNHFNETRGLFVGFNEVELSDEGLRQLASFNELGGLTLFNVPITDQGVLNVRLGNKSHLVSLVISGTKRMHISDRIMSEIGKLTRLGTLKLCNTEVTSEGLRHIEAIPSLQTIQLSGTRIDDSGLKRLSKLHRLSWLALGDTNTTDEGIRNLQELRSLNTLLLNNTKVTDKGLESLTELKNLHSLRLDGTAISDEGLKTLLRLEKLQDVSLDNTAVTVDGLKILHSHPALRRVSCQHLLTGKELEEFWSELPTLKKIRAENDARRKNLEEARRKGFVSDRTVILRTLAVGKFDANDNFTSTDYVPYEIGKRYGYQLAVHTPSGTIHIKEVLELPAPVEWSKMEQVDVDGVRLLSRQELDGGKKQVREYELDCPKNKWVAFSQAFTILRSDPQGQYRFTIYLNGDLAEEVGIEVGANASADESSEWFR